MTIPRRPRGFRNTLTTAILAAFIMVSIPSGFAVAETAKQKTHHSAAKKTPAKKTASKPPARRTAAARQPAHASIVLDADSGAILSQNGADTPVYPASLTKMMTLLIVFERLENNSLSLNQRLEVSNHAASQAPSKLDLPAGSSITLQNAIYAVVTKSANDMAVAIAENVGGSEGHFVYLMNEKAKALGMTQTRFMNPSGLHNPGQMTTARDWSKLSRYLIKAYPREYRYFSTKSFTYRGVANRNHNRLMETYTGMDGIKTGFIQPSGFNLAASAVRNNRRLIAIVFGGQTTQARNNEVAALLDRGFTQLNPAKTQPAQPLAVIAQNKVILMPDARLTAARGVASAPVMATAAPAPVAQPKPQILAAKTEAPAAIQVPQTGAMGDLAGQGDSDPAVTRRFETGMMAIAAIKSSLKPGQISPATTAQPVNPAGTPTPQILGENDWAIQLGSYASRVKSDEALNAAMAKLPADMKGAANPVIVPLKAGEGWVYRARLRGFSREQAAAACQYFNGCLAISPRAF